MFHVGNSMEQVMTRINVGVDPWELPDKLLLAEHREITRIPNAVSNGRAKLTGIPPTFTLGTGHVKFFYDKLGYLKRKYADLYTECCRRGFNVTDKSSAFEDLPGGEPYQPSQDDRQLIVDRIESKGFVLLTRRDGR